MFPKPPTGFAKVIYVAGLLVASVGMAIFFFALVTTIADGFRTFGSFSSFDTDSFGSPAFSNPLPDTTLIADLLPIAFGLAVPGMLVAGLASAIGPHPNPDIDFQVGHRFGDGATYADRGGYIDQRGRTDTYVRYVRGPALHEIAYLQDALTRVPLHPDDRSAIRRLLADADAELKSNQPYLGQVGQRLATVTQILQQAGALAKAGGELIPHLLKLAGLLGGAGSAIMQFLH